MMGLFNRFYLWNSKRKWGLYNQIVISNINWVFPFRDRGKISGSFHSRIESKNNQIQSTIWVDLNNRVSEDVIMTVINHEVLHVAICHCLKDMPNEFVEKVIEGWLMGQSLVTYEENGQLHVSYLLG